MRKCPVAQNWRENTLRTFRFAWAWGLLITSYNLSKTLCATVLSPEIGVKTLCARLHFLELGVFWWHAKTCPKHRAQLSCCPKVASKHCAQLSFFLNLATFVKRLKLVEKTVRNCPVSRNWPQNTAQLSFLLNLATFVKAKAGAKHSAQLSWCSKLVSRHSAQLSFFLKLGDFW